MKKLFFLAAMLLTLSVSGQQLIQNGETGLVTRNKINGNFTYIYGRAHTITDSIIDLYSIFNSHILNYNHADIALNTAARHSAVTVGTANGLSLTGQQLNMGTASGSTTGSLTSTDWSNFDNKISFPGFGISHSLAAYGDHNHSDTYEPLLGNPAADGYIFSSSVSGGRSWIPNLADTTAEWVSRTIYVSKPTDPQTPGSDVTGTGGSLAPFATILKALKTVKRTIMSPAVITLQLDSGSFDYGNAEANVINSINNLSGDNSLIITGQIARVSTYPVLTLVQDGSDKTKFTCSNYTFTTNELQGLCLSNSANSLVAGIESNTSTVIYSIAYNNTANYIVRLNSTLNSTGVGGFQLKQNAASGISTGFWNVKINLDPIPGLYYMSGLQVRGSIINALTTSSLNIQTQSNRYVNWMYVIYNRNISADNKICISSLGEFYMYNVLIKNSNAARYGVGAIKASYLIGSELWVSGFKTAFSNYSEDTYSQNLDYLKVSNCTELYEQTTYGLRNSNIYASILYLDNVDYLILTRYANLPLKMSFPTVYNSPNLGIFHSSSVCKDIVNPTKGTQIYFPVSYPENEQAVSISLANNATDSIFIGNKSYNRTIELKANITRGTNYQYKRITILNSGTTLTMIQQPDSIQTADLGVRIDGVYYSGTATTAVIKLKWHTTNTGTAATFKYDAIRQNY
jgi:hypothetical protein